MKTYCALALSLLSAFMLTACKEETNDSDFNGPNAPAEIISAPSPDLDVSGGLDPARYLRATFTLTTQDGRTLDVTAAGYCEKITTRDLDAYRRACAADIARKLEYAATQRECFEGVIAATGPDVRNHAARPQRADDKCHDTYPPNYASFPEEMMRRTLSSSQAANNLYTVTNIQARTP